MIKLEYYEKPHDCCEHKNPNRIKISSTKYVGEDVCWTMETDCGDACFDILETIYFCPYCGTKLE